MIKDFLDEQAKIKNNLENLFSHPDPLQIVYKNIDDKNLEFIALLCALFAYGNANAIVKFLSKLDFSLLDKSDDEIRKIDLKYRFQNSKDIQEIFITLKRFKQKHSLKTFCEEIYKNKGNLLDVIFALINEFYSLNNYTSAGYEFFFSKVNSTSAYKRYCMYFRWMCRKNEIDLGIFNIHPSSLLIPLDTHTHKMGLLLGLVKRKQANQKTMLELSKKLKEFSPNDPLKYDFTLYRLSQTTNFDELKNMINDYIL